MRKMRLGTKIMLKRLAIAGGALFVVGMTGLIASVTANDDFLAQTLAYADEKTKPTQSTPVVHPVEVDSNIHFSMSDITWEGDTAWVRLADGRKARLTLRKDLMDNMDRSFSEHPVPYGGGVAVDPSTGRILAISSASNAKPTIEDYALRAVAPSASVFKLVTSAALLEKDAVDPQATVCYSGGASMLTESDVRGNPNTDNLCRSLEYAIGHSTNAIIARLAYQHLSREDLESIALKFGFNREIPFELPLDVSFAEFVEDDIERAKTAAGFWHVNLSPFHGALLAAAIINDGVMMRPTLVDAIYDTAGNVTYTMQPKPWSVVMTADHAKTLAQLAQNTTREGTAKKAFSGRKGWKKGVVTGGKTGTLSNKLPFYTFNWYVGWGVLNEDKFAVGSVVVNTEKWWIKGTNVASRVMGLYFHE